MLNTACCETCRWWEAQAPAIATAQRDPSSPADEGACHVDPPRVVRTALGSTTYFPATHASRFCSAWKGVPVDGDREDHPDSVVVPLRAAA